MRGHSVPLPPRFSPPGAESGSCGPLDSFGRATASFDRPTGFVPELAGVLLHHAFAVLGAASAVVD